MATFSYPRTDIPVGVPLANTNDVRLFTAANIVMVRFVLPVNTTMRSFINFFRFDGTTWSGNTKGYGGGSGGIVRHRLCNVDSSGFPVLATPLAEESVACETFASRSRSLFGYSNLGSLCYHETDDVELEAGVPYASVVTNSHSTPLSNWFALEAVCVHPTLNIAQKGNYIDPDPALAPPSTNGLDHRCVLGWKKDINSGSWLFGAAVGGPGGSSGGTPAGYYDGLGGDDHTGMRLPCYGWIDSAGTRKFGQPYNAYDVRGAYSLNCGPATYAKTVTHAGAYVWAGESAGTITVTNVTKSVSRTCTPGGSGLVEAALNASLEVAVGDQLRISNTGTGVLLAQADGDVDATFGTVNGMTTTGQGNDRAELYCRPWPYHPDAGTVVPTPSADRALSKTATASSVEAAHPEHVAANAVDGVGTTRWASALSQPQWWKVDLGANYLVEEVVIDWEAAYATSYTISTSLDDVSYTAAASVTLTNAGQRTTTFTPVTGRYVRVDCLTRATVYGFSFWSVNVFGDAVTTGVPVTLEHGNEPGDSPAPTLSGTITSSTAQANTGANSWLFDAAANNAYLEWALSTTLDTTYFTRFYFWMGSAPAAEIRVTQAVSTAGTGPASLRLANDRTVRLVDSAGGTVGSVSSVLALSTWHYVEMAVKVPAVGNGQVAMRVNGTEVVALTALNVGNVKLDRFRFGKERDPGTTITTLYGDDVAVSNIDWVGGTGGAADTTPPQTTLELTPPASTTSASATFRFASSEQGSTFEYRLDGGAWTVVPANPMTLTGVTVAAHTFDVRAKDPAGNVDASPASFAWTRTADVVLPNTTLLSFPPDPSPTSIASFDWEADKASTFEYRADGGAWTAGDTSVTLTNLAAGAHTFDVRATDLAGNVETTPASYSWEIIPELSAGAADWYENRLMDHARGLVALPQMTIQVVLFSTPPTDAGGGTEPTTGSYAPVAAIPSMWNPAPSPTNAATVSFPTPTAAYTVVAWGLKDTASGNLVVWNLLQTPRTAVVGQPLRFPPGALSVRAL